MNKYNIGDSVEVHVAWKDIQWISGTILGFHVAEKTEFLDKHIRYRVKLKETIYKSRIEESVHEKAIRFSVIGFMKRKRNEQINNK